MSFRRIVKGIRRGGRFHVEEMITKRRARRAGRRTKLCHECGKPIEGEYYSDRLRSKSYWGWITGWHRHKRGTHYGPSFGPLPYRRMYTHLVCDRCWRGEKLSASGNLTKFIDLGMPAGLNVSVAPFRGRK